MEENTNYWLAFLLTSTIIVGGIVQLKYLYFFVVYLFNWVLGDVVFGEKVTKKGRSKNDRV